MVSEYNNVTQFINRENHTNTYNFYVNIQFASNMIIVINKVVGRVQCNVSNPEQQNIKTTNR